MSRGSNRIWQTVRSWWRGATEVRRALRDGRGRSTLAACVEPLERRELPAASATSFRVPANPDVLRSQGPQSTLVVRVDLEDRDLKGLLGDLSSITTLTDARIRDAYAEVNEFYTRQSFGKLTFPDDQLTIVPGRMSVPFSVSELEKSSAGPMQILKSVEKKLRDKGYNLDDYLHITIIHPYLEGKSFEYAGLGYLAGDRLWLNANIIPEVWAHELGHNAGAPHVGVFDPKDPQAIVADAKQMKFLKDETAGLDFMESGSELVGIDDNGDMFALRKTQFGWLDIGTNVVNVTQSGQYRLFATDSGTEQDDRVYALRIRRNSTQEYWLEYRESQGDGVTVTVHNYGGDKKLGLLDMTPESSFLESTLDVGSIFDDLGAKIHVTPLLSDNVDGSRFIDLRVTIGEDLENHDPTGTVAISNTFPRTDEIVQLTATVDDLDGDRTQIHWDFGDGVTQDGTLTTTHAWQPGAYQVRFTINDGRGGVTEYVKAVIVNEREPAKLVPRPQFDMATHRNRSGGERAADVASDGDNRFVSVWYVEETGHVMARRFEGTKSVGNEFVVGESFFYESNPAVAMDQNGDFVVVWRGREAANSTTTVIRMKKFSARGEPQTDELVVTSAAGDLLSAPNVAIAGETGEFVVTWARRSNTSAKMGNMEFQRFNASGVAASERQSLPTSSYIRPAIAMQPAGQFVIAGVRIDPATSRYEVFAQRFDAIGTLQGESLAVGSTQGRALSRVEAAYAPDGGLAFVYGNMLANLRSDGTAAGSEVVMQGNLKDLGVAIDQNGNRFVTGTVPSPRRFEHGMLAARLYSADGVALSGVVTRPPPEDSSNRAHWTNTPSAAYLARASGFVVASEEYHSPTRFDSTLRFFGASGAIQAEADSVFTPMNQKVSVFVTGNDTNPLPDGLKLSFPIPPAFGTVSVNANGTPADFADDVLVYTPNKDFNGTDEVIYQVTNAVGATAYGVLRVHVGESNSEATEIVDPPVYAIPNRFTVKEDAVLKVGGNGVLKNEVALNRGQLTAELVNGTTHGTLMLNPNGSFIYRPDPNFSGTDSFSYRASNGEDVSLPTTVTIRVEPVTDKPALSLPKMLVGVVGTPLALPIVASTVDADGSESILLKLSGLPSTATLNHGVKLSDGTWRLRAEYLSSLTLSVTDPSSFTIKIDCFASESFGGTVTKASASLRINMSLSDAA